MKGKCKACRKIFEGKDRSILDKLFSLHIDTYHKRLLTLRGITMRIIEEVA